MIVPLISVGVSVSSEREISCIVEEIWPWREQGERASRPNGIGKES